MCLCIYSVCIHIYSLYYWSSPPPFLICLLQQSIKCFSCDHSCTLIPSVISFSTQQSYESTKIVNQITLPSTPNLPMAFWCTWNKTQTPLSLKIPRWTSSSILYPTQQCPFSYKHNDFALPVTHRACCCPQRLYIYNSSGLEHSSFKILNDSGLSPNVISSEGPYQWKVALSPHIILHRFPMYSLWLLSSENSLVIICFLVYVCLSTKLWAPFEKEFCLSCYLLCSQSLKACLTVCWVHERMDRWRDEWWIGEWKQVRGTTANRHKGSCPQVVGRMQTCIEVVIVPEQRSVPQIDSFH